MLTGVDPGTFKYLNDSYFEDKHHVYNSIGNILSDDPSSFALVEPPSECGSGCIFDAKDDSHKYLGGELVK